MARLLAGTAVASVDDTLARRAGMLLARSGESAARCLPHIGLTGRLRGDVRRNCVRRLGGDAEADGLSAETIERRLDLVACAGLPPLSKIPASGAEHYAAGVLSTR